MKGRQAIVSLLFVLVLVQLATARTPCAKRVFSGTPGINSFTCVCNGTYCDTIDPVDTDDKQSTYQEYVTGRADYRLEKFKNKLEPTARAASRLNITINRAKTYQQIIGFGGAITDAAAYNIYTLSPEVITQIVNAYFGDSGLQYNVIRVPVGGVDFSMREYTYDDVPNDFNLTQFKLGPEDVKWKIPFVQAALKTSKKPLKMFASAWTAPPWMKTNNDYKGNGTLIGEPGTLYWQTWANYYVKFFQAYKSSGIDFWAMTAQNEPSDGDMYKFSFNCMGFTPQTQAIFVAKNLGPTLEQNGFGDIKIMILDDQRIFLPGWIEQAFAVSPDVRKYVDGIAVHWYMDSAIPAKLLDETHVEFPDKFIFGTEACAGAGPFQPHVILGGFNRAESYTRDIIQDLNHWVTGWTDWNMALDLRGGPNWANNFVDSPIIVNITSDEFYKQPMFYAMGHFAKFIPEKSIRVDASAQGDDLKGKVSFTTLNVESERRTVVVMLNEANEDLSYSIYDPDAKQYINSVISAHSIKTITWFY